MNRSRSARLASGADGDDPEVVREADVVEKTPSARASTAAGSVSSAPATTEAVTAEAAAVRVAGTAPAGAANSPAVNALTTKRAATSDRLERGITVLVLGLGRAQPVAEIFSISAVVEMAGVLLRYTTSQMSLNSSKRPSQSSPITKTSAAKSVM